MCRRCLGNLNRIQGPFNVVSTGQAAAEATLADREYVAPSRKHNRRWRGWFADKIAGLGSHGLRAAPGEANFPLFLFEGALSAEQALAGLTEAGYAVRHLPGQGLGHALHITIGTEEDMQRVVATLHRLAASAG